MSEPFLDMSPEEWQELLAEFLTEGDNHLQVLNAKLLQAEASIKAGTSMSQEDLNAMFRAAHTIKGTASFIGLKKIVGLTHEMETILTKLKTFEMKLSVQITDVLFKAFDTLEQLFSTLRNEGQEQGEIEESVKLIQAVLHGEQIAPPPTPQQNVPSPEQPHPSIPVAPLEEKPSPADTDDKREEYKINEKYLQQFIADTVENIERFDESLLGLEKDKGNKTLVNELFRAMHTIKGSSGIINAKDIQHIAHSMENILSTFRDSATIPSDTIISLLFESIDAIRNAVEALKSGTAIVSSAALCQKLSTALQTIGKESAPAVQPASKPEAPPNDDLPPLDEKSRALLHEELVSDRDVFNVSIEIDAVVQAKDMKMMLVEERLQKKGKVVVCNPPFHMIPKDQKGPIVCAILFSADINEKDIRSVLSLDGVKVLSIERLEKPVVKSEQKPEIEKQSESAMTTPKDGDMEESGKTVAAATPQAAQAQGATKSSPIELSTIRVDSHKIDNLMNLSGELVITRARFSQLVSQFNNEISFHRELGNAVNDVKGVFEVLSKEIKMLAGKIKDETLHKRTSKNVDDCEARILALESKVTKSTLVGRIHALDEVTSALGKISSDIQSGVMQTRMIPIEGVFTRFKRVVRDISKALKKEVNLIIEGEETELDKKIVDSLGDPLTHMIRNAVDHGVENLDARRKAGKSEIGTVFLRASHKGNSICIEVGDDGKGLDAEKLMQSAVKKGVITAEQGEKLNERERLDLIFAPGFSTAEKVTDVSGRGVGMDVVKNMITSVNGIVEIQTEVGKGTTFILKIPLTLAIIQALLVIIGDEPFALPLDSVVEIIKVGPQDIYSIDGNDTVKLRGHALSIVELAAITGIKGTQRDTSSSRKIVVITDGEQQLGVVVDSLIGEDEIVIKSLTDHFANVKGITGASILGDGRIALILDPITIVREAR